MEFDIEAGVKLVTDSVNDLKDELKKLNLQSYIPIPRKLAGSGVADANGFVRIKLGKPNQGRMWNVTTVTVSGSDDHTAIANSLISIYVGDDNNSLSDLLTPGILSVPNAFTWNKDQVFATPNDTLWVIVNSAAQGDIVHASAQILDYNRSARWGGI